MNQCVNPVIKTKKVDNFVKYAKNLETIEKRQAETGHIARNVICGYIKSAMMQ